MVFGSSGFIYVRRAPGLVIVIGTVPVVVMRQKRMGLPLGFIGREGIEANGVQTVENAPFNARIILL